LRIRAYPAVKDVENNSGVGRVIREYETRLTALGFEYVEKDKDAEIIVSHAGTYSKPDVLHLHGLYWTADYNATSMEYSANATIAEAMRWTYAITVPSNWVAETIKREFRFVPDVIGHGIDRQEWQHNLPTQDYALYNKNRDGVDVCDSSHLVKLAKLLPGEDFVATVCKEELVNVATIGTMSHEDMKPFIQSANIYLSLVKETFGIGVLEALASGVPVLGFAHGGNLDIVEHQKTGYLAKVGDYEDLANGYLWIKENRVRLSPRCIESVERFSWDSIIEQVASVYKRAFEDKQRRPTFSIVIPCYNYARYLPKAVESALGQKYPYLEKVVIVNDGSTDDTREVALELVKTDNRLLYIEQENAGVANARNTGIKATSSKYVTCLDADDELLPNFAKLLIPELEKDRRAGIAYGQIHIFGEGIQEHLSKWPTGYDYQAFLKGQNQVPTMSVFRRDLWERLGGYKQRYAPQGAGAEDAEFWLRFGNLGYKGIFVRKPVTRYRLGGSTSKKQYKEPQWRVWHPFTKGDWHNFCSIAATTDMKSHPVTQHDEPQVSIVIPVGPGHEHFLVDALDSLEAQTYRKWEAIVVWDTSNKIDRYILNSYPYIRFIDNSKNKKHGAGVARNIGAKYARGKYIVFLDADDYLQTDFLISTKMALEDNQDLRWVYTDFSKIADGKEMGYDSCEDFDIPLIWAKSIAPVTFLMYTEDFNAVGGFEEEHNREDWDFQLRLVKHGFYGARLPLPLFTYRIDSGFRREYIGVAKDEKERQMLHQQDVERIHNTFKELEKMACGSCKKKIAVVQPGGDMATLVYVGGKYTSDVTWRGKATGKAYRTSAGILYNVAPEDAKKFVESGLFVYKQAPPTSPPLVSTEPKVVIAKEPVDRATRLAQINEKLLAIREKIQEDVTPNTTPNTTPNIVSDVTSNTVSNTSIEISDWLENPGNYTLPQIKEFFAKQKVTTEQVESMKEAEAMGKARKGVISYLESKV